MARKTAETKKPVTITVAGAVTPAVKEAIEEHRWSVRQTLAQFVTTAVLEKVEREGLDLEAAQARVDAAAEEAPTAS